MLEDTVLKLRFNNGDAEVLYRIYEKYKDELLKLAVALLNDINLAEDVVHDSFVGFTESMGQIRLRGNLKSFLATCIANRARNVYRARQRKQTVDIDQAGQVKAASNGPEQTAIFNEQCQRLNNAMMQLVYEQREIIILHCYKSIRLRQIARLQGVSANTVKSRYRYGVNKLRKILNSELKK